MCQISRDHKFTAPEISGAHTTGGLALYQQGKVKSGTNHQRGRCVVGWRRSKQPETASGAKCAQSLLYAPDAYKTHGVSRSPPDPSRSQTFQQLSKMNLSQHKHLNNCQCPKLGVVKDHFYLVFPDNVYQGFVDHFARGFHWVDFKRGKFELEVVNKAGNLYGGRVGETWSELIPASKVETKKDRNRCLCYVSASDMEDVGDQIEVLGGFDNVVIFAMV